MRQLQWIGFLLVLPLSTFAQAIWVGPDCRLSWNPNPPEELVQGYQIYVESTEPLSITQRNVGNTTEITCSALGLVQGRYEAYVTAYNPIGESPPSARLPFVLVTSAPDGRAGVSIPTGLAIESAGATQ